jgi:hypothetical protein
MVEKLFQATEKYSLAYLRLIYTNWAAIDYKLLVPEVRALLMAKLMFYKRAS